MKSSFIETMVEVNKSTERKMVLDWMISYNLKHMHKDDKGVLHLYVNWCNCCRVVSHLREPDTRKVTGVLWGADCSSSCRITLHDWWSIAIQLLGVTDGQQVIIHHMVGAMHSPVLHAWDGVSTFDPELENLHNPRMPMPMIPGRLEWVSWNGE